MDSEGQTKVLINIDDTGATRESTRTALEVLEEGIATSATVLVDKITRDEIRRLQQVDNVSYGLHFAATREGLLNTTKDYLYITASSPKKLIAEFNRQHEEFRRLFGHEPHVFDGHHHIHMHPYVRSYIKELATELGIPVRSLSVAKFVMDFHAHGLTEKIRQQRVSIDGLMKLMSSFKPGFYEIMSHAGAMHDKEMIKTGTRYSPVYRAMEAKTLLSAQMREFVENNDRIMLINWKDVPVLPR